MSDNTSEYVMYVVRSGDVDRAKELINTVGLSYSKAWLNGYNLLCNALERKHPEMVKLLLMIGAQVNSESEHPLPDTPLHSAVDCGYAEIVSMLLDRNADVNAIIDCSHHTPLHRAVDRNNLEIVKLLIGRNALINIPSKDGMTALSSALNEGKLEIVKELLKHNVRVDNAGMAESIDKDCTPLHFAVFQQDEPLVKLLLSKGSDINAKMTDGKTALHIATYLMDEKMVRLLLESGADVYAQEKNTATALYLAGKFGYDEIIEILLSNNVNLHTVYKQRFTLLHWAAEKNVTTVVTTLLDSEADINAKADDGATALHVASEVGHFDVVKLLVERNAYLNAEDENKSTPLHRAASNGHHKIVEMLLTSGANIDARNNLGRTALHLAAIQGTFFVAEVLLEHGADVNVICNDSMVPFEHARFQLFKNISHCNVHEIGVGLYRHVAEMLRRHIVAMFALNLYVNERNYRIYRIDGCRMLKDCRTEQADMKKKKVGDSNVTFYDVLIARIRQVVSYARNESIVEALESMKLNGNFPIYSRIIIRRLRQGQKRNNLQNLSLKSLTVLCGYVLPDLFTEELFTYLSNEDLQNLINANPNTGNRERLRNVDIKDVRAPACPLVYDIKIAVS